MGILGIFLIVGSAGFIFINRIRIHIKSPNRDPRFLHQVPREPKTPYLRNIP